MKLTSSKNLFALTLASLLLVGCDTMPEKGGDNGDLPPDPTTTETASNNSATTASTANNTGATDNSGIPAELVVDEKLLAIQKAEAKKKEQLESLRNSNTVYFDFDQSTIKSEARDLLRAHAAFLAANPDVKVVLEGHCDERGTPEYNMSLGEKRAKAVSSVFRPLGVSASQMSTVSYGEQRLADQGATEAAHAKNRRVVIVYQ